MTSAPYGPVSCSGLSARLASAPYGLVSCLGSLGTDGQRPLWTGPLPRISPHGWPAPLIDRSAASGLSARLASAAYGLVRLGSLRTVSQCPLWTGPLPQVSARMASAPYDLVRCLGSLRTMASAPYGLVHSRGSLCTDGQLPLKSSTNEIFTPSLTRNDTNIASDSARQNYYLCLVISVT